MDFNYFGINFPNHITLVVKTKMPIEKVAETVRFGNNGLRGPSGAIYNPTSYLSISVISPDDRTMMMARDLDEVVIA